VPVQSVGVTTFYTSYEAPKATREPTLAEYEEMNNRTAAYFETVIRDYYANSTNVTVSGVTSEINGTLYGAAAGIPRHPFNIYINFSFAFTYTQDSIPPDAAQTFAIMKQADLVKYIFQVVRTFTGSPFQSTKQIHFAACQRSVPVPAPVQSTRGGSQTKSTRKNSTKQRKRG
jgi:hypothetical protein